MDDSTVEAGFPNLLAVVDYLNQNGWKIRKSALYLHGAQGKLLPRSDGAYTVKAVEKYAKLFLKRRDGRNAGGGMEGVQEERQRSEARKVKFQADLVEMKSKLFSGSYVEKGAFEHALAQRAALFKSDIQTFCRTAAPEIIHMAGGDSRKVPELIEFMLDLTRQWLERYDIDGGVKPMTAFLIEKEAENDTIDEDDDRFYEDEG